MGVWQKQCPLCHRKLEKVKPEDPWRCECSYTTDVQHKRRVYRGAPVSVHVRYEDADDQ